MQQDGPAIAAPQSRAGRALLGWSPERLAREAGISLDAIKVFEADRDTPDADTQRFIRRALEAAGVLFLPEVGGEGCGVRLKFPRQTVKRIEIWENEGGTPGEDDVG